MYDSESSSEAGWIDWFCDLEGHEFFVTVSHQPDLDQAFPYHLHAIHLVQVFTV